MKRLMPIIAALTILAGPLAMGGEAWAKDQHGGGHRSERSSDRGGRGAERGGDRGGDRGGPRASDRGGYERRGGDERRSSRDDSGAYRPRGPDRGDRRGQPDRGDRRGYESPPYAASPRRGGYMPPQAGGAVPDYGRYRLRPPPRGFRWVRTGNGYAMVSEESGRVYDVVPY